MICTPCYQSQTRFSDPDAPTSSAPRSVCVWSVRLAVGCGRPLRHQRAQLLNLRNHSKAHTAAPTSAAHRPILI
eukprot:562319-Pyramimonas_sp.AAC.1